MHRDFGTEVPCSDNDKQQFIGMRGGLENRVNNSTYYKILGLYVGFRLGTFPELYFSGELVYYSGSACY